MSNNLQREIEIGEIVIIDPSEVVDEFKNDTRFKVLNGFGMQSFTYGGAITGIWMSDGFLERYEGYQIEPHLTAQYQDKFGKFGELDPRTPLLPKVE